MHASSVASRTLQLRIVNEPGPVDGSEHVSLSFCVLIFARAIGGDFSASAVVGDAEDVLLLVPEDAFVVNVAVEAKLGLEFFQFSLMPPTERIPGRDELLEECFWRFHRTYGHTDDVCSDLSDLVDSCFFAACPQGRRRKENLTTDFTDDSDKSHPCHPRNPW
jgi:hypothetical protein